MKVHNIDGKKLVDLGDYQLERTKREEAERNAILKRLANGAKKRPHKKPEGQFLENVCICKIYIKIYGSFGKCQILEI